MLLNKIMQSMLLLGGQFSKLQADLPHFSVNPTDSASERLSEAVEINKNHYEAIIDGTSSPVDPDTAEENNDNDSNKL